MRCIGVSEPIAKSGWRRTPRSTDSEKSKRATGHRHLDGISKLKDVKQARSTVCSLSGKESCATVISYRSTVYASDRAKASAFVQEYVEISGRKSNKDSRKAVMDFRYPTQTTRTNPNLLIVVAFTPDEISMRFINSKRVWLQAMMALPMSSLGTCQRTGHQFY